VLKSFAGGRLFGGTWGPGVPGVLALHGWARSHRDFDPVFAPVTPADGMAADGMAADGMAADGMAALGPDLFGFGATPAPPSPWGSEEYARHLLPLFEEPGVLADRVVVVGHSLGGRVAVHLPALVPDRIERLVLTGVPLLDRRDRRSRPPAPYRLVRRLHGLGLIGEDRMEAARNRYGSRDYRQAQGVMRGVLVAMLGEQYAEAMAAVGCPVDLVWGGADTEVPVDVARRAQTLFPEAGLTVLPGVGHLVPTEAPGQLLAAIRSPAGLNDRGSDPTTPDDAAGHRPPVAPRSDVPGAATP
jgi:pimeloyl-ACP methyl ester carboxylesterase